MPVEGIHVLKTNARNETVLVIFHRPESIVVYGELPAPREYCKAGNDVTGIYTRLKKQVR